LKPQAAGLIAALALVLMVGCPPRQEPAPPPAPASAPAKELEPWTWHRLGGLLVVEGEVEEPVDLRLKGRYLNEHRHAEYGPVRWEMYAPPPGEVAELRSSDGKLLARWDFNARPGAASPQSAALSPKPSARPEARASAAPLPKSQAKQAPLPSMAREIQPHLFPPAASPAPSMPSRPASTQARLSASPSRIEPPIPALPRPEATPLTPTPPAMAQGWPGAGEAFNLLRGPRGSRQICLTFDGGSNAESAQEILDALKVRGIRTTLFLTGSFIHKFPDLVRRMAQEGHELGNHTMNHPHFAPGFRRDPAWTKTRVQQELLAADAAMLQLLGRPMDPYWRAPYGEHTSEIRAWAEELGYRHVGWSEGADTLDWATASHRKLYRSGDAILDRLRARMERSDGEGLIVLMHLGSERPAEDRPTKGLGAFLDQAMRSGWTFVNAGAYLQAAGKPRWDSAHRVALLGGPGAALRTASKR